MLYDNCDIRTGLSILLNNLLDLSFAFYSYLIILCTFRFIKAFGISFLIILYAPWISALIIIPFASSYHYSSCPCISLHHVLVYYHVYFQIIYHTINQFTSKKIINKNNAYNTFEYIQMLSKCTKLNSEHLQYVCNTLRYYIYNTLRYYPEILILIFPYLRVRNCL